MDDREREVRRLLAEMTERYQRAFQEEANPLIDELTKIEARKPPPPILGQDGNWDQYTGPSYDDFLNET